MGVQQRLNFHRQSKRVGSCGFHNAKASPKGAFNTPLKNKSN